MLCFNKLTGENNAKNTLKIFRFVGVYIFKSMESILRPSFRPISIENKASGDPLLPYTLYSL